MKSSIKYKPAKRKTLTAKNGGRFSQWLNSPKVQPWIVGTLVSVLVVILTPILSGIIFLLLSMSANQGLELATDNATSVIVHVGWTVINMLFILLAFMATFFTAWLIGISPTRLIFKSEDLQDTGFTATCLSVILSIPIGIAAFIVFGPVISIF